MYDIANGPVWRVVINCEDGRRETYWHRDKHDVLASIEETWSQVRETIEIFEFVSSILVVPTGGNVTRAVQDPNTALLVASKVHALPVLSGPTHY